VAAHEANLIDVDGCGVGWVWFPQRHQPNLQGQNRAVVQVFEGIRAERALNIRFINTDRSVKILPPILSAVEVLLDK
jgi:hypothetical protein